MSELGWQREFEDPISLPDGRKLLTLKDAAEYITRSQTRNPHCRNGKRRSKRSCCAAAAARR